MPLRVARTTLLISVLVFAVSVAVGYLLLGPANSTLNAIGMFLGFVVGSYSAIAIGLSAAACVLIQLYTWLSSSKTNPSKAGDEKA